MADAVLSEAVKRKRAADALNGQDDEEDTSDVQNGEAATGTTKDSGETDTPAEEEAIDQEAVSPVTEEKAPSLGYRFVPVTPPAQNVPQNVPQGTYPTIAEDQTGAPTPQIYTGPAEEGGQRYVIDPDTGQKIPYAEPATAEDKAAQPPPSAKELQQIKVQGQAPVEPAPDTLTQVERGELVKPPAEAPGQLTQVERGELVKVPPGTAPRAVAIPSPPAVKPAQPVSTSRTIDPGIELTPEKYKQITGREWMPGNIDPGIDVTDQQYKELTGRDRPKGDIDPGMTMSDDKFRRITGQNRMQPAPAVKPAEPAVPPVPTAEYTDRVQKWRAAMQAYGFDAKVKPDGTWTGVDDSGKEVTPEQNKGLYQFGARLSQQYGFSGQEEKLGQLGDAVPTAPAVKPAEGIPVPPKVQPAQPVTTNPNGSDLPQRVQAVGNKDPAAFIVHHTSSRSTVDGVLSTLKERGLGVEYVMDRDGNIFQTGGPGAQNILKGWGPKGEGLSNQNIVGMEIIAKDDADVTPAQKAAFARFIAARYPNTALFGHGEVNPGHKEADEGLSAKAAALEYRDKLASGQVAETAGGAPQAQPVTKQANGLYQNEKPEDFLTGKATTFATPEDIASGADNGRGAKNLGHLDTTSVAGIAIPEAALRAKYGNNYAAWRTARVDVVDPQTGKRLRVPIVDVGPRGDLSAITDMTPALSSYFGGDKNLMVKLVDNAGPDVMKNPQLFEDEQAAIRQGFDSSAVQAGVQKIAPSLGYSFKPVDPARNTVLQQGFEQASRAAITQLPEQNKSLPALINRLDQPIKGVPDAMRRNYQQAVKDEATKYAQDYYGIKDPKEALAKIMSSPDAGTFFGEIKDKALPYLNQAVTAFNQSAATIDQNRLDDLAKAVHPEASPEARKAFINGIVSEQDPAARAAHINAIIGNLAAENPNNPALAALRATDIADSAGRLADPGYQQRQKDEIARQVAVNVKALRPDPRLQGTTAGWWADQFAQLPKNVIEGITGPLGQSLMLSEIYQGTVDRLRKDNPGMSEDELRARAAGSTMAQIVPAEVLNRLAGGKLGTLTRAIENPVQRIGLSALAHLGIGGAAGAAQQVGINVAEGKPTVEGVLQAAGAGAVQAVPGVAGTVVHGAREPGTRPEGIKPAPKDEVVQPPLVTPEEPQLTKRPLSAIDVLGDEPPRTIAPEQADDVLKVVAHNVFPDLNDYEAKQVADRMAALSARNLETDRFRYELERFLPQGLPYSFGSTTRLMQSYRAFQDGPTVYTALELQRAQDAFNAVRNPQVRAPGALKLPIMWREVEARIPEPERPAGEAATAPATAPVRKSIQLDSGKVVTPEAVGAEEQQPQGIVEEGTTVLAGGDVLRTTENKADRRYTYHDGKGNVYRGLTWAEANDLHRKLKAPAEEQPAVPVTQEDVARRAYELNTERTQNGQPGTAADDYAQAQKELNRTSEPILPATVSEAEPINSAIANRYVQERMATGELGQIDPSQGKSTEDMVQQGLQMSRTQRDGLIDNFMKAKGGDLDQQGAAIRSKEALLSEQARAASRATNADPTNSQLQAQAKAAADAVTAFHNGPIKKFKQVWSDSGRALQREIPLDYTTFNGMKEAYLKGKNKEAPADLEPKLKRMADAVSKSADAERVAMNNYGKEIEKQSRGKTLLSDDQIRTRLMEIMKDLPCPT
jgi:hypothetical protein